jgi:hypothetical protein
MVDMHLRSIELTNWDRALFADGVLAWWYGREEGRSLRGFQDLERGVSASGLYSPSVGRLSLGLLRVRAQRFEP